MKKLKEKDFIHEEKGKSSALTGVVVAALIAIISFLTIFAHQMTVSVQHKIASQPFSQVTNRQMSLFLWQHPEFARSSQKTKTGYMPAFQIGSNLRLQADLADQFVVCPPEVLFRYHTWKRHLADVVFELPISDQELEEFLEYCPEWTDLAQRPLPDVVRQAFTGWKNYVKQGQEINAQKITPDQVMALIKAHPHFARNYWRNIYPNYLKSLSENPEVIPNEEIPSFLRVALFNFSDS